MKKPLSPRLTAGLMTLALWALVTGSALWWWLRVGQLSAPLQAPVAGQEAAAPAVDTALVARALGATAAQPVATASPDVAGRLRLSGIVTHDRQGAALIAIDGKPPRPVRVGAPLDGVEGGWRLRSVTPHAAVLAAGGRELRLEMPALAQRSTAGDAVAPPAPGLPGAALRSMPVPPPSPSSMVPVRPGGAPKASAHD